MKTFIDCIPCLIRQAVDTARFVTEDTEQLQRIVIECLRLAVDFDISQPPPAAARQIYRKISEMTGNDDPYRDVKKRFNRMVTSMLPALTGIVASAQDPFMTALRLSIAGNVIDFGVNGGVSEDAATRAIENAMQEPLSGDVSGLRQAVSRADSILYLADNAGEIVLDRLFIGCLPADRVTVAVRGGPAINDATLEDAHAAGLHEIVNVIDNGYDAPGTLLDHCSPEFQKAFADADLVISKGQGNFETLLGVDKNIFYLFKVKCTVAAMLSGLDLGTHAVVNGVRNLTQ